MADMFAPLVAQLKANPKTIVFTEGNDPRILEAAAKLLAEGVLKVVMVGNEAECKAAAAAGNFDISAAEIIDPENYAGFDEMVNTMVELRKGKQTAEECTALLKKSNYFGTMLVKMGKADCLLGGATYSTADTIRPALQLVKTKKGAHLVSSCFILDRDCGEEGLKRIAMGDCAVNIDYTDTIDKATGEVKIAASAKLAEVAIETGNSSIKLQSGIKLQDILNVSDKAVASKIEQFNNFFGLNLSMSPSTMFNAGMVTIVVALIIPILAGLFQLLSVQLTTKINSAASSANMADNPMAGSMKAMNIMMPLMSVYMCWILSAGIGLYWMAGSLVMILQQIFINLVLKNEDIDEIIEKNKDKAAAKAAKRKEKEGIYREKVLEASKVNAKNISSNSGMSAAEKEEKIRKAKEAMSKKEGSLASKVNMVSEFNKRNEK